MGLGQYNSLGEYCSPHAASFVFLILINVPSIDIETGHPTSKTPLPEGPPRPNTIAWTTNLNVKPGKNTYIDSVSYVQHSKVHMEAIAIRSQTIISLYTWEIFPSICGKETQAAWQMHVIFLHYRKNC